MGPHLYEDVDAGEGEEHQPGEGRGQQQDDADLQELKEVAQHHLQPVGDHAVDGVHLLGEAVQEVPAGRRLEEGDGRAQHAEEEVGVEVAGRHDAAQGNG